MHLYTQNNSWTQKNSFDLKINSNEIIIITVLLALYEWINKIKTNISFGQLSINRIKVLFQTQPILYSVKQNFSSQKNYYKVF